MIKLTIKTSLVLMTTIWMTRYFTAATSPASHTWRVQSSYVMSLSISSENPKASKYDKKLKKTSRDNSNYNQLQIRYKTSDMAFNKYSTHESPHLKRVSLTNNLNYT